MSLFKKMFEARDEAFEQHEITIKQMFAMHDRLELLENAIRFYGDRSRYPEYVAVARPTTDGAPGAYANSVLDDGGLIARALVPA